MVESTPTKKITSTELISDEEEDSPEKGQRPWTPVVLSPRVGSEPVEQEDISGGLRRSSRRITKSKYTDLHGELIEVGTHVQQAPWGEEGKLYPGRVIELNGNNLVTVKWDDARTHRNEETIDVEAEDTIVM